LLRICFIAAGCWYLAMNFAYEFVFIVSGPQYYIFGIEEKKLEDLNTTV